MGSVLGTWKVFNIVKPEVIVTSENLKIVTYLPFGISEFVSLDSPMKFASVFVPLQVSIFGWLYHWNLKYGVLTLPYVLIKHGKVMK